MGIWKISRLLDQTESSVCIGDTYESGRWCFWDFKFPTHQPCWKLSLTMKVKETSRYRIRNWSGRAEVFFGFTRLTKGSSRRVDRPYFHNGRSPVLMKLMHQISKRSRTETPRPAYVHCWLPTGNIP
jgi:hypothetical protein